MIKAHFENIRNLIIDHITASNTEIKIAVAWLTIVLIAKQNMP